MTLALVLALSRAAGVDPLADGKAGPSEQASRAQVAYDLQDWPTAIKEYRAAYQVEQRVEYLWGLAQALRFSGDCRAAIPTYKAYRRGDVSANQATAAELMITKCEAELAKQEAEATRATTAERQPAPAASPELPARVSSAPDKDATAPAPTAPRPKRFYEDVLGDTLLVAGAAAGGVGAYFLLRGNSDVKSGESAPTYGGYVTTVEDAETKQKVGAVALGAGGVLLACAVVRYLTFDPLPNEQVLVGAGGIAWRGRF